MKNIIAAAAALALGSTASAQSTVTLFGTIDTVVQRVSNQGGASATRMTQGGYNTAHLGFRGTEDLGGGVSASFFLEAGLNTDTGSGVGSNTNNQPSGAAPAAVGGQGLTFNRRSTVSVAGSWGEVRLGRDYLPQYRSIRLYDPLNATGAGQSQINTSLLRGILGVWASNTVQYFLPQNSMGVSGQFMHFRGENASGAPTSKDGTGWGMRLGYSGGPISMAAATGTTQLAAGDLRQSNIGGRYDFQVAKVFAVYERDSIGALRGKGWLAGGLVPVGVGEVRASYSQYATTATAAEPTAKRWVLGYAHHLSKRTALYGTYARVTNSGGGTAPAVLGAAGTPAPNLSSTGLDIGIRHHF